MFRFKAIFVFVGSFCRFKILGRVFDHNRDTIGLFSLTHLCGKLRCARKGGNAVVAFTRASDAQILLAILKFYGEEACFTKKLSLDVSLVFDTYNRK